MPQATEAMRKRWKHYEPGGGDQLATKYLEERGYVLTRDWRWVIPPGHKPTAKEIDAVQFMVDEWDYGGFVKPGGAAHG